MVVLLLGVAARRVRRPHAQAQQRTDDEALDQISLIHRVSCPTGLTKKRNLAGDFSHRRGRRGSPGQARCARPVDLSLEVLVGRAARYFQS